MSWSRALTRFITDAFRPPFRTAPWIALAYVILSFVYNPDSTFNRWVLPDTDDYMRLSQMMAWVNGQSWFDLHVPRLYPQHPIDMHWARLPDILLAGIFIVLKNIALFFRWEVTQQAVGMLTAFFTPWLLLTALLFLVREMAKPLLSRARAGLVCFVVPLCTQLIFQFVPMRVDHHAYIVLFAGVAFYALQCFSLHLHARRMMALAGLALALAMWNGAEILPMLVCFCLALTFMVIYEKRNYTAPALFGGSLLFFNSVLLFIARPPAQRWSTEYDAFSFFYVILAALCAGYFAVIFLASRLTRHRGILLAVAGFTGLSGVALLLNAFPDFIYGPYAKANPALNTLFFPNIREAIPLYRNWADLGGNFMNAPEQTTLGGLYYGGTRMFIAIAGLCAALYMTFARGTTHRRRKLWALMAFFIFAFSLLSMFWQVRVITYAQLFGVVPLVWLLLQALQRLARHYSNRQLFAFEILAVFMLTLFPVVILPAMVSKAKLMPDTLFYLARGFEGMCSNRTPVITYLHDITEFEKKTVTIMSPMDYAPELMFYTNHNFISAPYHRNDRGILDMVSFFRSPAGDSVARGIAKRLNLDYVLMCKGSFFQGTLNRGMEIKNVQVGMEGNKAVIKPDPKELKKASLGMRLSYGETPDWLIKREIPMNSDFLLLEVNKKKLGR